uniref:Uncharacterized protein n=1 Tax=Oryza rufipogon TaxID=4529 RepID=A0A0E0NFK8_ORYRU
MQCHHLAELRIKRAYSAVAFSARCAAPSGDASSCPPVSFSTPNNSELVAVVRMKRSSSWLTGLWKTPSTLVAAATLGWNARWCATKLGSVRMWCRSLQTTEGFHTPCECDMAFGADQFKRDGVVVINDANGGGVRRASRSSCFNWYHFSIYWGYVISTTLLSYVNENGTS